MGHENLHFTLTVIILLRKRDFSAASAKTWSVERSMQGCRRNRETVESVSSKNLAARLNGFRCQLTSQDMEAPDA